MITSLAMRGMPAAHVIFRVNMTDDLATRTYYYFFKLLRPRIARFIANSVAGAVKTSEVYSPMIGDVTSITRTIPNGVDAIFYRPPTADERRFARKRLGIMEDETCILSLANFNPMKRVDWLLRAFAAIAPKRRLRLLLLGDGVERARLERQSEELGIGKSTQFLGRHSDVRPILWAADVGALCSRSEGCSNALLEQMASGVPVVASAVGGTPELLSDGRGLMFAADSIDGLVSALQTLVADLRLRETLARRALEFVRESRAHQRTVARYESEFRAIAARSTAGRGRDVCR
jgi:glycosyltransferase involved in cell wall biosynthesis